ncbi:MAG TPA: DUF2177 family protein [Rhizomicrobium sp.]
MTRNVIRYAMVLAVLAIGDALWLSYFAKAVFRPALGQILLDEPRWLFVVLFYLLYAFAIMVFPVASGLRRGSRAGALLYGALFGLFAYMTYDLTNLATIKAWTVPLAAADMAWGAVLTAIATVAGYLVSAPKPTARGIDGDGRWNSAKGDAATTPNPFQKARSDATIGS